MDITQGDRNGHVDGPQTEAQAARELLGEPFALGYERSVAASALLGGDGTQVPYWQVMWDIPAMLAHPSVLFPFGWFKAGIANVQFKLKASSSAVGEYALAELTNFWERSLAAAQCVYDYGWLGAEARYHEVKGLVRWHSMQPFFPLDVVAVTRGKQYRGFNLDNVAGARAAGKTFLWGGHRWPAKGLWFAHNRAYDRFYGRSQLYGAWRPWRQLGGRDGAEEVTNLAVHRHGVGGFKFYYPPTAFQKTTGGMDYDAGREKTREFVETAKAGAGVALPNVRDQEGNRLWELEEPQHVLDVSPLIAVCEHLDRRICAGIGIPHELLEASQTGSGFSGRMIPAIGYFAAQLQNARGIVHAFETQVLTQEIRWMFGPDASCEVKVELVVPPELTGVPQQPQAGEAEGDPPGTAPGEPDAAPGSATPGEAPPTSEPPASGPKPLPKDRARATELATEDEPRTPKGQKGGGEWTTGDGAALAAMAKAGIHPSKEFQATTPRLKAEFDKLAPKLRLDKRRLAELVDDDHTPAQVWEQLATIGAPENELGYDDVFSPSQVDRLYGKLYRIAERALSKVDPSADDEAVWKDWEDAAHEYTAGLFRRVVEERAEEIQSAIGRARAKPGGAEMGTEPEIELATEAHWSRAPDGPRGGERWQSRTGQVVYSHGNPGAGKGAGVAAQVSAAKAHEEARGELGYNLSRNHGVAELRAAAKKLGLESKGAAAELVKRLEGHAGGGDIATSAAGRKFFHVTKKGVGSIIRQEGFKAGTKSGLELGPGVYLAKDAERFPTHLKSLSTGEVSEVESLEAEVAPHVKFFKVNSEANPVTSIYRALYGDEYGKRYDADSDKGLLYTERGLPNWEHLQGLLKQHGFGGIERTAREGDVGNTDVVVFDAKDVKPVGGEKPDSAPASDPTHHVLAAVSAHAGPHNLASLVDVRRHLSEAGVTDRAAQDAAIHAARKAGLVTGVGLEGRHGATPEEVAAQIREEGGHGIGYLSKRTETELATEDEPRTPKGQKGGGEWTVYPTGAAGVKRLNERLAAAGLPLDVSRLVAAEEHRGVTFQKPWSKKEAPSTVAQHDPLSGRLTIMDSPLLPEHEKMEAAVHELTHAMDHKLGPKPFHPASKEEGHALNAMAKKALEIPSFKAGIEALGYRGHEMLPEAVAYLGSRWARKKLGQPISDNPALDALLPEYERVLMEHAGKTPASPEMEATEEAAGDAWEDDLAPAAGGAGEFDFATDPDFNAKHPRGDAGRWASVASALVAAHPHPGPPPPLVPGMGLPHAAKDPRLAAAKQAMDAHAAASGRSRVAGLVHDLLTGDPPQPVPLPLEEASSGKRVGRARRAVEAAAAAKADRFTLGPAFAPHQAAVEASHPDGAAALGAARAESARRHSAALATAEAHVAALPPEHRAKALKSLEGARLREGPLQRLLAEPLKLTPLPAEGDPPERRVGLAKRAVDAVDDEAAALAALGSGADADHPDASAVRQEQRRRYEAALTNAESHVAGLPPETQAKARKKLDGAKATEAPEVEMATHDVSGEKRDEGGKWTEGGATAPGKEETKEPHEMTKAEFEARPLVRTVGKDFPEAVVHGTTKKSADAFLAGQDLPESERSKTISEWGADVLYTAEKDAPHQAVMFARGKSQGKGGQRTLLEFRLKSQAKVLDLTGEMTRRPAMGLQGEQEGLRIEGRPSFTDDLINWLNEKRAEKNLPPLESERARRNLDPTHPEFEIGAGYMPYLARYARDRGFAALRLADETVVLDRNAIASARRMKPAEIEELANQPRKNKPLAHASLYTADVDREAKAQAHRQAVESALAAGRAVPPEVLADYPDLAAKPRPTEMGTDPDFNAKHPRGQPQNAGEFAPKPGGASAKAKDAVAGAKMLYQEVADNLDTLQDQYDGDDAHAVMMDRYEARLAPTPEERTPMESAFGYDRATDVYSGGDPAAMKAFLDADLSAAATAKDRIAAAGQEIADKASDMLGEEGMGRLSKVIDREARAAKKAHREMVAASASALAAAKEVRDADQDPAPERRRRLGSWELKHHLDRVDEAMYALQDAVSMTKVLDAARKLLRRDLAAATGAELATDHRSLAERIDAAAAEADPSPTPEQRRAGNYRKGHVTIQGLEVVIETARGNMRTGVSGSGKEWAVKLAHHYGYIRRANIPKK